MTQTKKTPIIEYFSQHLEDNDSYICYCIIEYIRFLNGKKLKNSDSNRFYNSGKFYNSGEVISYSIYYMNCVGFTKHHNNSGRLLIEFNDGKKESVSLLNFKRFLKKYVIPL